MSTLHHPAYRANAQAGKYTDDQAEGDTDEQHEEVERHERCGEAPGEITEDVEELQLTTPSRSRLA